MPQLKDTFDSTKTLFEDVYKIFSVEVYGYGDFLHYGVTNLAAEIVDSCLGQMSDFFNRHFTWLNCMLFHIIKDLSLI